MKLLVIGATRGIGRRLAELALDEGHAVTALVRDPGRLPVGHDRLSVIAFLASDEASYITGTPIPVPGGRGI